MTQTDIAPTHAVQILSAAERAARAIPPAFPLDATVAVNPYLGQTGKTLAETSATLTRVAGIEATQTPDAYLAAIDAGRLTDADLSAALTAAGSSLDLPSLKSALRQAGPTPAALPTLADLAAQETGVDWPSVIEKTIGQWAAGFFDRGQALWSTAPGATAWDDWRAWAMHDLTPEIAGLTGFCARVTRSADSSERAVLRAADALGLTAEGAETAFHRLYMEIGGWSQHARWVLWQAELEGGTDHTLADLLAIRLMWEEALLAHLPHLAEAWQDVANTHAQPVVVDPRHEALAIAQDATDRAHQRSLVKALNGGKAGDARPALQAAFCIDVRSEVFRRALEAEDAGIETIGFAGFFGLPIGHRAQGSDILNGHLPVLLSPSLETTSATNEATDRESRIAARATRAWGRFKQAAVSSFAFVEAAGPVYAGKLVKDALALGAQPAEEPQPVVVGGLTAEQKAQTAANVLRGMSLTTGHAPLILLLGHGGHTTNNPHDSAYHCGACGGQTGEVSSRVLAALLNDPEAREGLGAHGLSLPEDTVFVAGLHDTTTDEVTLYEGDLATRADLTQAKAWLDRAGATARAERALRLPGATPGRVMQRALNWAETRPEWGLAGCAAMIAAPRAVTAGKDLGGRAFLHSYDWRADEGFGTLEMILTAPVVVGSWISLQYYGSATAPEVFGGGNKLIHNVVGGFGVIEGNSGRLRPGLPLQSVHDGADLVHEPLRLSVMIEAPQDAILNVLRAHDGVRELFDNGWLHLFALEGGRVAARYTPGLAWEAEGLAVAA
ncbi:MAG: YbcC family protein [Shimia sp.]